MTNTEAMHQHILSAYHFAKQAHERCYYDTDTQTPADKTAALALTARSVSNYAAAAALYLENQDDEDTAIPKILKQFQRVTAEMRKVYDDSKNNLTSYHIELDYLEDLLHENGYC